MSSLTKIVKIVFLLLLIWAITKFTNGYYALPFWGVLFLTNKFSNFEYLSILVCTELYSGIDTLTFGPISIIQIIAIFILFNILKNVRRESLSLLRSKLFFYLLLIFLYFSFSYYFYYSTVTLSVINWFFIFLLTIMSFNGEKKQLLFFSWLYVVSVFALVLQIFIIQVYFYPDFTLAKQFAVTNSNHIGFGCIISLLLIILLNGFSSVKQQRLLKGIFYFFLIYIIFSGSRLNITMMFLLLLFLFVKPINTFWITRTILIILFLFSSFALIFIGGASNVFFRNNEYKELSKFEFSTLDDLKDGDLGSFTSGRSIIYFDALELIKEKTVFGNGFLSWNDKNNRYNSTITSSDGKRISMHSTILQYWAETGIIGLLLYLMYLFGISRIGKKIFKTKNRFYYLTGKIIFYIPVFLFLSGTLDNHSLNLGLIHLTAGIGLVLLKKQNDDKKYIILH